MDATRFVYYARDSQEVVGVNEFQLTVALLQGQTEELSQQVPSQWGPAHLFDLCLTFGHVDTALAMAGRGVEGCRLEADHLRRNWRQPNYYQHDDEGFDPPYPACKTCRNKWSTCDVCSFGFSTEQGVWMTDWDVNLEDAVEAAWEAAELPLVRATLQSLQSAKPTLPFTISPGAMTHLLDLAILTGNKEAARHCAEMVELRPLRRWHCNELVTRFQNGADFRVSSNCSILFFSYRIEVKYPAVLLAALSAGSKLRSLASGFDGLDVPLREALALEDFAKLLPPENPQEEEELDIGNFFIEIDEDTTAISLSSQRLQKARMERFPLKNVYAGGYAIGIDPSIPIPYLSLLDLAILFGQSDCAALCASAGVEVSEDGLDILPKHLDADPARRPAAIAAAEAAMSRSWKSQISGIKGITVYRLMEKLPQLLVKHVMAFAMEVPPIVEELNLWTTAHLWSA